jgi:hypothetical protein
MFFVLNLIVPSTNKNGTLLSRGIGILTSLNRTSLCFSEDAVNAILYSSTMKWGETSIQIIFLSAAHNEAFDMNLEEEHEQGRKDLLAVF